MAPRKRKNPHADAGRIGGKAKTPAKTAAARENAKKAGRPAAYMVEVVSSGRILTDADEPLVCVTRHEPGETKRPVVHPLPARALAVLAEWLRTERPGYAVQKMNDLGWVGLLKVD